MTGPTNISRRIVRNLFYRDGENILSVLQVQDFRNLWTGQMISFLGDALAYNTMTLAIIRMANDAGESSGRILSALFVLSALPSLFLGMIAGTIVDRANRKHMMIGADLIRGVLVLGYLFVHRLDQVWIYIVITVCLNIVSTFFFPARTAMLPQILARRQLLSANALAQLTHTLAVVVGAAVAGVLVGVFDHTSPAFIADSLTFFVSAFFIARITVSGKIQETARQAQQGLVMAGGRIRSIAESMRAMVSELLVGLRYVLTDQVMRGVLISFLALMLGLGAANVTFVPLLIDELGIPEEGLGLVRFSQTLGIIIGSAFVTVIAARYRARSIIGVSMIAFGITTVMVSVITSYPVMVGVLFLVGLALSPPQIVASTMMQKHVPSEKLGRASGAQGAIVNVANIASMGAAGFLMDEIGARMVFTLSGVIIASAGGVSWWVLRNVENIPDEAPTTQDVAAETEADTTALPVH